MKKIVSWFSGGVSSFIATYLVKDVVDEIIFIDIKDHHEDTYRFIKDCEIVLGKKIQIIKSEKYNLVSDVIKDKKYINSPYGSPCTTELKKKVRLNWEKSQNKILVYVWGYDADEVKRANRIKETMVEYEHMFPLIERHLSKDDVHGYLTLLNIKRPKMYEMGYRNNNCVGCVKGGKGYWNKIRKDFPEVFNKMAKLEREIGGSCIAGIYLDELDKNAGSVESEIMEDCGILCQVAYQQGEQNDR